MIVREEDMNTEKMSSSLDMSSQDQEDLSLPGFRFHPTDEELVGFYLRRKVEKKPLSIEIIKQTDIYKYDPWDLPKVSTVGEECYFFCRRGRKYKNSIRPNRVTGSGFWKATGIDRPIYSAGDQGANDCIGLKKSLVYYRGSAGKGTKTDWMMHEFRLPNGAKSSTSLNPKNNQEAEIWTICRIFKRTVSFRKYTPDWSGSSSVNHKPTDASSKTCSFESDNSFPTSTFQIIEKTPHEEKNQMLSCQSSLAALYSSSDTNELFREGNWDELRAIVEFANDPAFLL